MLPPIFKLRLLDRDLFGRGSMGVKDTLTEREESFILLMTV